ncbi:GntR family transcriptional regulator [Actinokineospora sp. NBRC 105648]|uniref:GntR family transcriptional regulator n=1 Tax=Actinokineospora sp. NBRC 105648 TaxID=3032206 RepID=UPI0024A270B9|nr:GntR family transcriptional regulator [Actinokineospora sp. NBRC 105648]GLZ42787.1 GntR family transcriptional regulator [Actinokineospora sp. NBRC 105648]
MTGSRSQWLIAELRERVALGDYGPGGSLESEADLGRRYAVSRVTVRRALEHLRGEGLLAARKGAGWYVVSGASFGQSLALGSFQHAASAVAEAGIPLGRTVVEYGYGAAPESVAHLLGVPDGTEALRVQAVRRAGEGPLDVVTEWVPLALAAPVSRADAEDPGTWEALRRKGNEIAVVRQSIAATAAGERVAELLEVPLSTPVLLVRRLALGPDERPIALSEHRYLGHRFRLEVEFRGWPATAAAEPPGVAPITTTEQEG